jgi:hypothetical protein
LIRFLGVFRFCLADGTFGISLSSLILGSEYACQPDVSAMFGEHYGLLFASSEALVDLKKELQSAYMSTKLNQFGLPWNLLNNSKLMEN